MMRWLQSAGFAGLLGILAFLGTLVALWHPQAPAAAEDSEQNSSRQNGPSWEFHNPEVDLMIEELRKQKDGLSAKEKDLNELAARLQTERSELNQLTQAVQQAQAEFDHVVTRVHEQETTNLKKLAKMYTTIAPEGAAAVFKGLDDTTVVKILTFMKEAETAAVLEVLARQSDTEAKRVAAISEQLRLAISDDKKRPTP